MSKLHEKLSNIQNEFKASKSRYNSFGKYNYRSAEDILEALKPINKKYGVYFLIEETIIPGDMPIIVSKAVVSDGADSISATATVGVDLQQKGMQVPQAFGSASSYGKKYALGNLLLIDDTQDADATNTHGRSQAPQNTAKKPKMSKADVQKAKDYIKNGGSIDTIKKKYDVTPAIEKQILS